MGLDTIQRSVLASASAEANRIVKAAEQHAGDRVVRELESIRREQTHRYQLAARAIEDEAARKVSRAKGEASKRLLERRNALLDRIFGEARANILAMPRDRYAAEMRKRLELAAGNSGGAVRVHPDDAGAFESMLASFNAARAADARVTLDASAPLPNRGGFVFVAGAYDVDQTLDSLLANLRHEMEPQLAAELFPG
ncbi:MAG: hypothetical protein HUU46_19595 [Candidatus Hydrogenedentes bacterium]|nr:hypothetical protein [Candidatus Hydrogenedentota bacterium]